MVRGAIVFAAGLALAATAASAKDDDNGKAQTEEATKEKKICKTEKVTGSLTRVRRTCMTQREWDEVAARTRRGVDDFVRKAGRDDAPTGSNPGPGGF